MIHMWIKYKKQTFPQLAEMLEPTPDVGDHYLEEEILLPSGDKVAGSHVVAWSHIAI